MQLVLYQICVFHANRKFKMAAKTKLRLTLNLMGISCFHLLLWNYCRDFIQTLQKCKQVVLYHICVFFYTDWKFKMAAMTKLILTLNPMRISHFLSSFWKQVYRFQPYLAEMLGRWSFTRFVKLVLIQNSTWQPGKVMLSDWSKFQTSSCQKLQSGLDSYFAGMIGRWSCT